MWISQVLEVVVEDRLVRARVLRDELQHQVPVRDGVVVEAAGWTDVDDEQFSRLPGLRHRLPRNGRVDLCPFVRRNTIGGRDRQHLRNRVDAIALCDTHGLVVVLSSAGHDREEQRLVGRARRAAVGALVRPLRRLRRLLLAEFEEKGEALAASRRFAPRMVCPCLYMPRPSSMATLTPVEVCRLFRENHLDLECFGEIR